LAHGNLPVLLYVSLFVLPFFFIFRAHERKLNAKTVCFHSAGCCFSACSKLRRFLPSRQGKVNSAKYSTANNLEEHQ
jgi:hypothetical protein